MLSKKCFISSAIILLAVVSGCGVKQATSPMNPILTLDGQEVKNFPVPKLGSDDQTTYMFVNNKVFIWKDHSTAPASEGGDRQCDQTCFDAYAKDIQLALKAGRLNDKLEDDAKPYYKKRDELKAILEPSENVYLPLEKEKKANEKAQSKLEKQIEKLVKILPSTPENDAKILDLQNQLAALKSQLNALLPKYETANNDYQSKLKDYTDCDDSIRVNFDDPMRAATQPLMEALGADVHGNDNWYKDMPSHVFFRFENNGTVNVEIKKWTVDGKEMQNFSTENGLIRDVTYEEKGGVFRFKLDNYEDNTTRTKLIATYTFELARARYEQTAKDGRLFMAGEFTRETAVCDLMKELCKRKGSVKLASD